MKEEAEVPRRAAIVLALAAVLAATGCSGDETDATPRESAATTAAADSTTSSTRGPSATEGTSAVVPAPAFEGLALPTDAGTYFSGSGACASCHQQMTDGTGADVSLDAAWRSTMMANAARDPYWTATVRAEVGVFPELDGVIQDKCTTCHMPMARTTASLDGSAGSLLDAGFGDPGHPLAVLASDGVSCSLCHQIEPSGLGAATSFSGGFTVPADLPPGERIAYGPYDAPPGQAQIMQSASGFIPVRGEHIQGSEVCATCHTLYTPTVDASGEIVGEFAEQTPYLEWQASAFADAVSCQDCHLPEAAGSVQLSITGGPPRSPFSQHHFVGGNTFMVSVFRAVGERLDVTASSEHFDATLARIEDQLANRSATASVVDAAVADGRLVATVNVGNLAGHKFPTGFPARRAWLHVTVRDGSGMVVFESGAPNPDGSIAGNDNDADPLGFEPHHERITVPDQVQIYESIVVDTDGAVTTTLLRGAGYVKDNRLLPAGFELAGAGSEVAPAGGAANDPDFAGGSDTIVYDIDVAGAEGPFTFEVEVLFQSIGYRWIENLLGATGAEVDLFADLIAGVPNIPALVALDAASVG